MEQNLEKRVIELEAKIDAIYISVEKTRKYILWTGLITLGIVVLPIIGLLFAIPAFLNNLETITNLGI